MFAKIKHLLQLFSFTLLDMFIRFRVTIIGILRLIGREHERKSGEHIGIDFGRPQVRLRFAEVTVSVSKADADAALTLASWLIGILTVTQSIFRPWLYTSFALRLPISCTCCSYLPVLFFFFYLKAWFDHVSWPSAPSAPIHSFSNLNGGQSCRWVSRATDLTALSRRLNLWAVWVDSQRVEQSRNSKSQSSLVLPIGHVCTYTPSQGCLLFDFCHIKTSESVVLWYFIRKEILWVD